jgi:hypothetical protein
MDDELTLPDAAEPPVRRGPGRPRKVEAPEPVKPGAGVFIPRDWHDWPVAEIIALAKDIGPGNAVDVIEAEVARRKAK